MSEPPLFRSKSEYAYDVIKRRILSEEMLPGSLVGQDRLAQELGVSTTPLREALKRLATEGLVELGAYRDARVSDLSADEARSLYEVRMSVDPLAARLAAERRTDTEAAAIERALHDLHPLTLGADWDSLTAHRAFHRSVYSASHNAPLIAVLEGLWDKADRYRQVSLRTARPSRTDTRRVQEEHRALAEAVVAADSEAAESVMRAHVSHSLGRRAIQALTTS